MTRAEREHHPRIRYSCRMLFRIGIAALAAIAAAGAADVSTTLEIWPQMIHAWPLWNARLEPGRRALARAGAFLRQNL